MNSAKTEANEKVAVTLAVDAGTSGTKVLAGYQSPDYHRPEDRPFIVGPAVRTLIADGYHEQVPTYQSGVGTPDDCLVAYHDLTEDRQLYFQIGHEAAMPGFLPVTDPKLTTYVAKILAIVGFLATSELKNAGWISLNLGCLLPFNEWADRGLIEQLLRHILSGEGFSFNGYPVQNVTLESIAIQPEGYGICRHYLADRTNVLMMGQRDSSWICFTAGKVSLSDSLPLPKSGMHSFVKALMQKFRVEDELRISQIISAAGPRMTAKTLKPLTSNGSQVEIGKLQHAIATTKAQFWAERSRIFQSLSAGDAQKVYVSGGCGYYFSKEITQVLKARGLKPDWCNDLVYEFDQRYPGFRSTRLPVRMADAYALYCTLPGVTKFEVKKAVVAPESNAAASRGSHRKSVVTAGAKANG